MAASKIIALIALVAYAEARFGQEQVPVAAVSALGNAGFGDPGVAATIAGSIPGSLLAAASPCQKLTIADEIITKLGTDQQVIDAAIGLVAAETNFNPFAVNKPFVCADATLPASAQLRGIIPLVDPAVGGSDVENANSEKSIATPFNADGLSQAQVMIAQGFSNFTAVDGNGQNVVLDGQDGGTAGGNAGNGNNNNNGNGNGNGNNNNNNGNGNGAGNNAGNNNGNGNGNGAGNGAGNGNGGGNGGGNANDGNEEGDADNTGGCDGNDNGDGDNADDGQGDDQAGDGTNFDTGNLDFGLCQPTMARIGGLNNRPADEFTFIPQDPLVAKGQQEALNPNIITNRICDQLTNVCEANDEAKAACLKAKAEIEALGTRDQSTADTWNALLGFAGVDSSKQGI